MVDARELLSPTWLPFAHALSVNAENQDLPGIQAVAARMMGVSSRDSRPVAAAIRPVSRVAMEPAVKISSFGGNVQRTAPSHQNWRSWSAGRNDLGADGFLGLVVIRVRSLCLRAVVARPVLVRVLINSF